MTANCDLVRQYAAEWVSEKGNPIFANGKTLLVGDFNAYEEEAPVEILVDAGYVDMVEAQGNDAHTKSRR